MSRTSIIVIIALLASIGAAGRNITGRIVAESDSTPIGGAVCRLLADGRFLTGESSDEGGGFAIETNNKSQLQLEISMTGYAPASIHIPAGSKNLALGDIFLADNGRLGEVNVTSEAMIDVKGRTIVFPSASEVAASATSVSLFQKLPLPGLEANPINRTVSVDGGTPMILIDGRPSSIDDVNALQPKDIAKIEYSRITPARYADRGTTGLISITLKKRSDGGQVYLWGRSALTTTFVDGNMMASYHQGPSQFTAYYSPSWRNYHKVYDNMTEAYIGDDFRVDLESHDQNPFNYCYHSTRLRYDFSPDIHTLFSATFAISPNDRHHRTYNHNVDSDLGEYDNRSQTTDKSLSPSLDLFFRRDFNDKNSLELQVVGTLSSHDLRWNNIYTFADGSQQIYIMDADSRRRSLISEISYIHNFSDKTQLSAGYQNTVSHSKNTYLTSDYQPILTENNNYVYARLGQQVDRVYLSASTGAKLFWMANDENRRHFVRNITTLSASWNINQKWNLRASFQYTPSIPSLSSLTDYPQQSSPYLISNGNPDLKVAENFTYDLSASYQYRKFTASYRIYFADIKNSVVDNVSYLGDGLFLNQSVNAGTGRALYNILVLKLSGIKGFGANVYLGLDYYKYAAAGWRRHLTSFEGSISLWWNHGPFTVSYWRKFPGKYLSGYNGGKSENGDALSLEYQPNSHWTFEASWMYMFDKKGTRYPSWSESPVNPSSSERYIKHNGNMVVLSVSYSADFGSIFRSARRNLNNSDTGSSLRGM